MRRRSQFGWYEVAGLACGLPSAFAFGFTAYRRGFQPFGDSPGQTVLLAACLVGPFAFAWAVGRATAGRDWQPGNPRECRRCGYDLTGVRSGPCPECGHNRHGDVMRWR